MHGSVNIKSISVLFLNMQYEQKSTQKTPDRHNFRLIFTVSVFVMHTGIATEERSCVIQEDSSSVYCDLVFQRNSVSNCT